MGRTALGFAGITVPADLDGPPGLLPLLAEFGVHAAPGGDTRIASIVVTSADGRFRLSGPAYRTPFSVDGLDAVAGSVMAGLAACKALSLAPHMLCIHGAAACLGDRTMLFIAPFGTGKSSLMAELALRGAEILSDDVVLVNRRDMSAEGLPIPMRLRRGFLRSARPALAGWIADRRILGGPRYTYLSPATQAGGQRTLTDIVLLNRAASGETGVVHESTSPGQLIPRILWHNMARHHAPSAISDMASALATGLRGSTLHFGDAASAAEHLLSGGDIVPATTTGPSLASRRHEDLLITRTDRGAIVSDDETGRIFEINESAFVILSLLQQVDDDGKAWQMLRTLYPEVPGSALITDVTRCLQQFFDCGLIDIFRAQSFALAAEEGRCQASG